MLQGTQGRPPSPCGGSARFCLDPHLHGNSGRSERTSAQIKATAQTVGVPVRLSLPARTETIEPGLGCKCPRRSSKNHKPYQIPTVAHRLCSSPCDEPESARLLASGEKPREPAERGVPDVCRDCHCLSWGTGQRPALTQTWGAGRHFLEREWLGRSFNENR